jgi:hypothetical protein
MYPAARGAVSATRSSRSSAVDVEDQRDALQHPVAGVLRRREVGLKHEAAPHLVAARLRDVDGRGEAVGQPQARCLGGDDLQQGELLDQLLGRLARQLAGGVVPGGALQVEPADVAAVPILYRVEEGGCCLKKGGAGWFAPTLSTCSFQKPTTPLCTNPISNTHFGRSGTWLMSVYLVTCV